ncbi:hypothetical protein AVEN_176062-1 [Araneus ventricosus]|uniref:Uncharacterized protein n=1 Tax=Araneus ventricosus TaxID=182803 RepID=A0A4Y2F6B2_ARAVE|nr:hypothetical protein AVEN_176062-1 [Araneus ventricosus]
MDSSAPFPSLRVVGDMNGRTFISPLKVPLKTTRPTAFSPLSEQLPVEIRPTSIEVAWPVTAGLGVRVIKAERFHVRNPIPLKIRRVLGLLHVKSYVGGKTSFRWCGAEVWKGADLSGVVHVI